MAVRRDDGSEAVLPSSLTDFAALHRLVQEETFRRLWPAVWRRFAEGGPVEFGDFILSRRGVHKGADLLAWADVDEVGSNAGRVTIKARGRWRAWSETPVHRVPNPHLLLTLIRMGPPLAPVPPPEDDEDET